MPSQMIPLVAAQSFCAQTAVLPVAFHPASVKLMVFALELYPGVSAEVIAMVPLLLYTDPLFKEDELFDGIEHAVPSLVTVQ